MSRWCQQGADRAGVSDLAWCEASRQRWDDGRCQQGGPQGTGHEPSHSLHYPGGPEIPKLTPVARGTHLGRDRHITPPSVCIACPSLDGRCGSRTAGRRKCCGSRGMQRAKLGFQRRHEGLPGRPGSSLPPGVFAPGCWAVREQGPPGWEVVGLWLHREGTWVMAWGDAHGCGPKSFKVTAASSSHCYRQATPTPRPSGVRRGEGRWERGSQT